MSKTLKDLKVPVDANLDEYLQRLEPDYSQYRILKKAVDARGGRQPHFVMSLEVFARGENPPTPEFELRSLQTRERPIIVGTGPAGLFAALRLAEQGVPCDIFERGSPCEKRIFSINRFWRYNELDPDDNVCFGEGGAGLYSDGKLITRIKSPHVPYVMNRFVKFGAPPEIEYLSNPHVGSDKIRRLIPKIRQYLIELGCKFYFNTKVTELLIDDKQVVGIKTAQGQEHSSPFVVLAIGHSATDMLYKLHDQGVLVEGKSYALGVRIEHPQHWVNRTQFRDFAEHPALGAANYKLTYNNQEAQIGVYSFCMCPGGYVLSSGTDANGVVCNGMSNYSRNSPFANSAVVVTVDHEKNFGDQLFGGMEYRQKLENKAWQAVQDRDGKQKLPAQTLVDFLNGRTGDHLPKGTSISGACPINLHQLFPDSIYLHLCQAFENFHRKMPGFIHPEALVYGVESRTSCPLRLTRHKETLESKSHGGLYPCGEGAGYAGGITSAACDGIRVAESICKVLSSQAVAQ